MYCWTGHETKGKNMHTPYPLFWELWWQCESLFCISSSWHEQPKNQDTAWKLSNNQ